MLTKRILSLSLMALALMFGLEPITASANPASSATVRVVNNAVPASAAPQRWNRNRPIRSRYMRSRIVTRNIWQGRRLYRVTYRITRDRFGRTYSRVIRSIRIR